MAVKVVCQFCQKKFGSRKIYDHYDDCIKEHNKNKSGLLIKFMAEDINDIKYFIYALVGKKCKLSHLDKFLRKKWCECCGHLSSFNLNGKEINNNTLMSEFEENNKICYEYDFGTTTQVIIDIVKKLNDDNDSNKIEILFQNEQPKIQCHDCCEIALYYYDAEPLCDKCAKKKDDDEALLKIVNSPRSGMCGYE